jgi:hypothetical protein
MPQTCHRMNNLVMGSLALRYTMSLAAAGLIDNFPAHVDLVERTKLLTEREAAWKDTQWLPIELHDNNLTLAGSSGNLLVFHRHSNDLNNFGRTLVFYRVPSVHLGVQGGAAQTDLDVPKREFSIDTSQSLHIYSQ